MVDETFMEGVIRRLVESLPSRRKYAGFFHARNKAVMERGIGIDFLRSWEHSEGVTLLGLRASPVDPPDLLADAKDGGLVGIELTEFASQEAVEKNETGRSCFRVWKDDDVIAALRSIIRGKDEKAFNDGDSSRPYSGRVLVIHTDEPMATPGPYRDLLGDVNFGPAAQLTDVFLLFSYHPGEGDTYPLIRLVLR
jgi:hypothetical protein